MFIDRSLYEKEYLLRKSLRIASRAYTMEKFAELSPVKIIKKVLSKKFAAPEEAYNELIDMINSDIAYAAEKYCYNYPENIIDINKTEGVIEKMFFPLGESFFAEEISAEYGVDYCFAKDFYKNEDRLAWPIINCMYGIKEYFEKEKNSEFSFQEEDFKIFYKIVSTG